jgi:hypothetical protein
MTFLTDIAAAQLAALQQYGIVQIGDVEGEPITLLEARAQCRVDTWGSPPESDDDFWLENIGMPAAREYCENYKGLAYAPRTLELATNTFPAGAINLPFGPVQSITSIKYLDQAAADAAYTAAYDAEFAISSDVALATAAGDAAYAAALEQTVSAADYQLDVYSTPPRVVLVSGASWPTATDTTNSVKVRYVTGYNLSTDTPIAYVLPPTVKMAMLLMLGHLFINRAAVEEGSKIEIPLGVQALLNLAPGVGRLGMA